MAQCFLVTGKPRSGTSMVANMLYAMGVFMGGDLGPGPCHWNANGFFEDGEFDSVYSDAMPALNMADFIPLRPAITEEIAARHRGLIQQRRGSGVDWGVKSNRLCYFLPDFGAAKLIWCKRTLAASAQSWAARTGISFTDSLAMMERCEAAIGEALRDFGGDVLKVDYDNAIESPDVAKSVADFVGRPEKSALAVAVVSSDLRRFF